MNAWKEVHPSLGAPSLVGHTSSTVLFSLPLMSIVKLPSSRAAMGNRSMQLKDQPALTLILVLERLSNYPDIGFRGFRVSLSLHSSLIWFGRSLAKELRIFDDTR